MVSPMRFHPSGGHFAADLDRPADAGSYSASPLLQAEVAPAHVLTAEGVLPLIAVNEVQAKSAGQRDCHGITANALSWAPAAESLSGRATP